LSLSKAFDKDNLKDYRFLMSAAGKKAIIDLHVNGICNYLKSFE